MAEAGNRLGLSGSLCLFSFLFNNLQTNLLDLEDSLATILHKSPRRPTPAFTSC